MIRQFLISFLLLISACTAGLSQFTMVSSSASWSTVDDSTYTATVSFYGDLTGQSYNATQIADTFLVYSANEQLYRISAIVDPFFSSATLTIIEQDGNWGSPTGQVCVYNPDGRTTIPEAVFGSNGATAQLLSAVGRYNARQIGTGGTGGSPTGVAGGDLTGTYPNPALDAAAVKSRYESNSNTNAFTDAEQSKLSGIEAGATADQSDAEIETAYNNIVSIVSQVEAEAGTATTVRRWTAERVKQAIEALAPAAMITEKTSGDSLYLEVNGVDKYVGQRAFWVTPQQFGAVVGDGLDDSDAIELAAAASAYIYFPPGQYDIHNEVTIGGGYEKRYFVGYGATLKRADVVSDTLTEDAPTTQSFIVVSNSGQFSVGEEVTILNPAATYGGVGHREHSSRLEIIDIGNDTLYLDAPLNTPISNNVIPATYPSGSKLLKFFPMWRQLGTIETHLRGLKFDGNSSSNNLTYSWKGPSTIEEITGNSSVENCEFVNIACENIFHGGNVTFSNNYAQNLGGSFAHYSSSSRGLYAIYDRNILIDVSLIHTDTAGHNEAVFTCSSQADSTIISNNIIFNTDPNRPSNGLWGNANNSDDDICTITGNLVFNSRYGVRLFNSPSTGKATATIGPIVDGNTFVDVLNVIMNNNTIGSQLADGEGYIGTRITGNTIVNGRVSLLGHAGAVFSNNYMRVDSLQNLDFSPYHLSIAQASNTIVSGNTFYCDKWSTTANSFTAIVDEYSTTTINGEGKYSIYGHSLISGNIIQGYNRAIYNNFNADATTAVSSFGTIIENNTMYQRDSSSATGTFIKFLANIRPGVTFRNNTMYLYSAGNGLLIRGVSAAGSANVNGPIVYGNVILGGNEAVEVGRSTGEDYNIVFINNIIGGPIDDNTISGRGHRVSGNITLPVTENVPLDWLRLRRNMN